MSKLIKIHLSPCLREDGFKGSGQRFWRLVEDWIHVLEVQSGRGGHAFSINLGLQPMSAPDVRGAWPETKGTREYLCVFRRRLTDGGVDQWWTHDGTEADITRALGEAGTVYMVHGRRLFALMSGQNNPVLRITPESLGDSLGSLHGFQSSTVDLAATLAHISLFGGDRKKAQDFARAGIAQSDRQSGSRHWLSRFDDPAFLDQWSHR